MSILSKVLVRLGVFLAVIAVLAAIVFLHIVRRSFPKESGEIQLTGLRDRVTVLRDQWGIPNIYASNPHDLFMAQGFVHAQDRFWQMDFWRHMSAGRLSELFGHDEVKTDMFLRTLGWERVARKEVEQLDGQSLQILNDYAAGVNQYLLLYRDWDMSLEFGILKPSNIFYMPPQWEPVHTLMWAKAMAWDLSFNMNGEIYRSALLARIGQQRVEQLYPPYPAGFPLVVPRPAAAQSPASAGSDKAIGSNNWVISGRLTQSGKPLLCNDPHLGVEMPSIWYEVGLHCSPRTADCPYDVSGFSFAGVPGVVIGHNDRIAWGFTNAMTDVQDLYVEKINPANTNQYEYQGQWQNMELIREQIDVANLPSTVMFVRQTRHGPIISDAFDALKDFGGGPGFALPGRYAVALKWTALEPSGTFPAVWRMNIARDWASFLAAGKTFDVPQQNTVYADVDGNIGYTVPGKVPIRGSGDGFYPVPGWTGEYEWQGYVPVEELPRTFNPPEGYIASANNEIAADSRYFLSREWDYGYRAERIREMIRAGEKKGKLTVADMETMQRDTADLNARRLVPFMLRIPPRDRTDREAIEVLKSWNCEEAMDSPGAAMFGAFWKHLMTAMFADKLPQNRQPGGGNRWMAVVQSLIEHPDSDWWDDTKTRQKEDRGAIFRTAFYTAVDELKKDLGSHPDRWRWGKLHTVTFRNPSFGRSGVGLLEAAFNRGPYATSGGSATVNASGWDSRDSYEVTELSSMRMIVDLADFDRSLAINTTGQSGHAFQAHYDDMVDSWRYGRYHAFPFSSRAVHSSAKHVLQLVPRR